MSIIETFSAFVFRHYDEKAGQLSDTEKREKDVDLEPSLPIVAIIEAPVDMDPVIEP